MFCSTVSLEETFEVELGTHLSLLVAPLLLSSFLLWEFSPSRLVTLLFLGGAGDFVLFMLAGELVLLLLGVDVGVTDLAFFKTFFLCSSSFFSVSSFSSSEVCF